MSNVCSGILVVYRWPPGSQQQDLPAVCHELSIDNPASHFMIHHGNEGNRVQNPWSPEAGTACAILHLRDLPPHTIDALDTAFAGQALPTRIQRHGWHASAVAWLPDHEASATMIALHGEVPKLTDLLSAGHSRVIHALSLCVQALQGNFFKRATSRYEADVEACTRAVNAVRAMQDAGPQLSMLHRILLPTLGVLDFLRESHGGGSVKSFPEIIAATEPLETLTPLRPGLAQERMDTDSGLRLMLHQISQKVVETVRRGRALCPRTGYIRPTIRPQRSVFGKGQGKQTKSRRHPHTQEDSTKSSCTRTATSSNQFCHPMGASNRPCGLFATMCCSSGWTIGTKRTTMCTVWAICAS